MKKKVTLVFLCVVMLVGLVGCREANEFDETTLTVVNDTDYTIDMIQIQGYIGYSARVSLVFDALPDGMELGPGEKLLFALPPVQAENSSISIYAKYQEGETYSSSIDFVYDEGAEVTLTLNPAATAEESPYFTIEGGTFVK